jgi:hypothetical protein
MVKYKDWGFHPPVLIQPRANGRLCSREFNLQNNKKMTERIELMIGRLIAIAILGGIVGFVIYSMNNPRPQYNELDSCLINAHGDKETHECFLKYD